MTPHAADIAPPEDLAIFNRIERIINELPDLELSDTNGRKVSLSCHILCRALEQFFPVEVIDGWIMGAWEHSWLMTSNRLVIDPYPIAAVGGPVMFDTRYITPWTKMYADAVRGCFLEHQSPAFRRNVASTAVTIQGIMQRLGITNG